MLRDYRITDYIVNYPAVYDEYVTVVEEFSRSKYLSTPAFTFCYIDLSREQASTPLPSRYII